MVKNCNNCIYENNSEADSNCLCSKYVIMFGYISELWNENVEVRYAAKCPKYRKTESE